MLGAPGGVRRPPARGRGVASGSTWWSCRATSTTGRCRPSTPSSWPTRRFARLAARGPRSWSPAATTTPPSRLGFGSRLIDAAGVHLRTRRHDVGTPVLLDDEHGAVAVYGLPYLDPDAVRRPWQLRGRTHEAALTEAMRRVRADLAGRRGTRSVVLAHAFVAGAQASDSERDICVGGVSLRPHQRLRRLRLRGARPPARPTHPERVRALQRLPAGLLVLRGRPGKGSWLVDLGPSGVTAAEFVEAPVPRPLARIRGASTTCSRPPMFAYADRPGSRRP